MGRLRSLFVAVCVLGGSVGFMSASAQAAPIPSPNAPSSTDWPTLVDQAFAAVQNYDGAGPVTAIGPLSSPMTSWVSTPNGMIAVNQLSVLASDQSGQFLVGVSDLAQQQLVVADVDPNSGAGTTLVLQPSSEPVGGSDPSDNPNPGWPWWWFFGWGVSGFANSLTAGVSPAIDGGSAKPHVKHPHFSGIEHAYKMSEPTGDATTAGGLSPNLAGGCYAQPTTPIVVGSMFGPLVQGTGIVNCPFAPQSISVLASLYKNSHGVGNGGGASTYGTSLAVNVFAGCSPGGSNLYNTAQLWTLNGSLQSGAQSAVTRLGCS
jgi:hypothetical protein